VIHRLVVPLTSTDQAPVIFLRNLVLYSSYKYGWLIVALAVVKCQVFDL
jgi:hypothetical protein